MGQRTVDQHADPVTLAVGLQAVELAGLLELGHLVGAEVAGSNVPDLALRDQLFQSSCDLREGRVRVGPVNLVQVYVVGTELAQAVLDALAQPAGAGVAHEPLALVHPETALGSQCHTLAALVQLGLQGLAEKPLGGAEALRGIEEVHVEIQSLPDRTFKHPLVGRAHSLPNCQVPKAIPETSS